MKTDSLTGMRAAVALASSLAILVAVVRAEGAGPSLTFASNLRMPAWLSPEGELPWTHAQWCDFNVSGWDRFPRGDLWTDYCCDTGCLGQHGFIAPCPHASRPGPGDVGGCPPPRPVWHFVRDLLGWPTRCCANRYVGTRPPRGSAWPDSASPEPIPTAESTDMTADIESLDQDATRDVLPQNQRGADRDAPSPRVTDPADPAPAVPEEPATEDAADLTDRMDLQPAAADDPPPVPPAPADADRETPIPRNELPPMKPRDPDVSRKDQSGPRMARRLSDYIQTR